jgi:hypothetical protein
MFGLQVRKFSLAQGRIETGKIIVIDVNGRRSRMPMCQFCRPGGRGRRTVTDLFSAAARVIRRSTSRPERRIRRARVNAGDRRRDRGYIKIPVCLSQPILTTVEIGALAAGVGLAAVGMAWKQKHAEVVGEVLVGAAAFTAIYRHSCL